MSWKRKGHKKPVELIFKFDSPRKFSKVNIFTANLLHLDIQVRVVSGAKMQKNTSYLQYYFGKLFCKMVHKS